MIKHEKEFLKVQFKVNVLTYARICGNATDACKEFDVSKSTFYYWKKAYDKEGRGGLYRKKPIAHNHPKKLSQSIVDKILELMN